MRVLIRAVGALAVYIAVLAGTTEILILLWRWEGHQYVHNVNPTVGAAIVAAVATVTVSLLTLVLGRSFERQKIVETALRATKLPIHLKLAAGLFTIIQSNGDPKKQQAAANLLFNEITPELVTQGSDEVLVAWSRYKRQLTHLKVEEQSLELERILMAIRRDQGHKGKGVREGDLLGLFLTDTDKLLANRKPRRIRQRALPIRKASPEVPQNETQKPAPEGMAN
jgi:hypothetical protein